MKSFFSIILLISSCIILTNDVALTWPALAGLYENVPSEYSVLFYSLLISALFFLLDRFIHIGTFGIIVIQAIVITAISVEMYDAIAAKRIGDITLTFSLSNNLIPYGLFYVILIFSRRLKANHLKKLQADLKKLQAEEAVKKEEIAEAKKVFKKKQREEIEIKDLQDQHEKISEDILRLTSKREKLKERKKKINSSKIAPLEENIQKEIKSFEKLKNKYPFLSKAKIIQNR